MRNILIHIISFSVLLGLVVGCGDVIEYEGGEGDEAADESYDEGWGCLLPDGSLSLQCDDGDEYGDDWDSSADCLLPDGSLSLQCGDEDWEDDTYVDPTPSPDDPTPSGPWRYVMVEGLGEELNDEPGAPGPDIDGISIESNGVERWATQIEEFDIPDSDYVDVGAVLGAVDSQCVMEGGVLSLGDGYIVVSFDGPFESGDVVVVYDLGETTCPGGTGVTDQNYLVSVSDSANMDMFVAIGEGGPGVNVIQVP